MIPHDKEIRIPQLEELLTEIRFQIQQSQRPAEEVILNDNDVCKMLQVSKRTMSILRSKRQITYSKLGGLLFYRLSDVLDFIKKNEVPSIDKITNNRLPGINHL